MSWPYDLSFDPAGSVYVADGGNHRVQVYSQNGTYLRTLILMCMAVDQVNCLAQGVSMWTMTMSMLLRGERPYINIPHIRSIHHLIWQVGQGRRRTRVPTWDHH